MELDPKKVREWTVDETESVQEKFLTVLARPDGPLLKDLFLKLKLKLNRYPPDQKFFSIPRVDLQTGIFWVRSENNRILLRAKYIIWAEICVIDRFYLSEEAPDEKDLEL